VENRDFFRRIWGSLKIGLKKVYIFDIFSAREMFSFCANTSHVDYFLTKKGNHPLLRFARFSRFLCKMENFSYFKIGKKRKSSVPGHG
jgi:hypothetical protein